MAIELLRREAIELIKNINHEDQLRSAIHILRGDEINSIIDQIFLEKFGQPNDQLKDRFSALLVNSGLDFNIIKKYLTHIKQNKLSWNSHICGITPGSKNIYDATSTDFGHDINLLQKQIAYGIRGQIGFGPDQGPGEFMLVLHGTDVSFAKKGDLDISGVKYEIKTTVVGKKNKRSGGRLHHSSHGYGSHSEVKVLLYNHMKKSGVPENVLAEYGWPDKLTQQHIGGFNISLSGTENLCRVVNKWYRKKSDIQELLLILMTTVFPEITPLLSNSILAIISNGEINSTNLLLHYNLIAFDYYKELAGFDRLMLFNAENGNTAIVDHKDQMCDLIHNGQLHLSSGIDWNDERGKGSCQLVLR